MRAWGLGVVLLAVGAGALAADPAQPPSWSGLIWKDAALKIEGRGEARLDGGPFTLGVVANGRVFGALVDMLQKAPGKVDPVWKDWAEKINWEKETVAYVILTVPTNRLSLKGFEAPKDGKAALQIRWDGIEPLYKDAFPAVFVRVPRENLKKLVFQVNGKQLSEFEFRGAAEAAVPAPKVFEARFLKLPEGTRPRDLPQDKDGARAISLEDTEKTYGKKVAEEMKKQLDPEKEELVVVHWKTTGPPYAQLVAYPSTTERVDFVVEAPKLTPAEAERRGQTPGIGVTFCAVTRGSKLTFTPEK
jgi:hypothetical protein